MQQIVRTSSQLGHAVRQQRQKQQLSQSELAAKAVVRQATISAIENGAPGTRVDTLVDVMAALGVELVMRDRSANLPPVEEMF